MIQISYNQKGEIESLKGSARAGDISKLGLIKASLGEDYEIVGWYIVNRCEK